MPLEALHDELMRSADELDVVGLVELLHHVASEQVARPARTHAPASAVCWRQESYVTTHHNKGMESHNEPSGSDHSRSHMGPS